MLEGGDAMRGFQSLLCWVMAAAGAGCATEASTPPSAVVTPAAAAAAPPPNQVAAGRARPQAPAPGATAADAPAWPPPGMYVAPPAPPAAPQRHAEVGRTLPHAGCRELGQIMGSGRGWSSTEQKTLDAYDELRRSTVSMGG